MIIQVHAANPGPYTGAGNWTYVVPGPRPLLVDAGVGEPAHLDTVAHHLPEGPAAIVVTHAHPDHASGVSALASRWPHARFYKWPWRERDVRYEVEWLPLEDGDAIDSGDATLQVVHTPGHSPDHICLWEAESRTLLSADLVVKGSTVVIPASHGGSLRDYLHSLDRVDRLNAVRFLPAHGDIIDDPSALIHAYKEHRRVRERQVLDALEQGIESVEAITGRIYRSLAPALVPMARESVLAHLVKLQHDGLAEQVDGAWRALR